MATATAASKRGRGRKALVAVLDNDANISAGKAAQAGDLSASASSSAPKAKRAPARSGKAAGKAAAKAAAAAPVADDVAELQGMLERLRLEKEKAEEMVRERDEVIRRKEEEIETREKEQERLQAELKKVQRAKEFKPTGKEPWAATTWRSERIELFVKMTHYDISQELEDRCGHSSLTRSNEKLCYFFQIEKLGYKLDFVNHYTTPYTIPACFHQVACWAGDQHDQTFSHHRRDCCANLVCFNGDAINL